MAGDRAALRTLGIPFADAPLIVLSRRSPPVPGAPSPSPSPSPSASSQAKPKGELNGAPAPKPAAADGMAKSKELKEAKEAKKAAKKAASGAAPAAPAAQAEQRKPAGPVEPGKAFKASLPLAKQLDVPFFSVLSYNVLLPNSQDGWWIYKYYRDEHSDEMAAWPARQALLKDQLLGAAASVVCLQEVCELSFADDFAFLVDAGYEALLHEKKGRMRPATFWRKADWELVSSLHKDRTLVVALRRRDSAKGAPLFVANGHLSAGHSADRRLRQAQDALEAVAKEAKRLGADPVSLPVVFCGDFNSQGKTAVRQFLLEGEVGPDFRESGDPTEKGQQDEQITSKVRKHSLCRFANAAECTFGADRVPPTILAANIDSKMLHDDNTPTPELLAALSAAFDALCSPGQCLMSRADVDNWLLKVNRAIGRGSEYRAAMAIFEKKGEETLSREEFQSIYEAELKEGKYWGVEHDLKAMGGSGLAKPSEGPTELTFDHVYFTPGTLRLLGVQEPLTEEQWQRLKGEPWEILPNNWHPSDHLPVVAAFALP